MLTQLQYGKGDLSVKVPSSDVTVLVPKAEEGLRDEAAAFREAVRNPIGSAPLRELVRAEERVAVVIPDITRALPRERLLPMLFEELSHVPPENFTVVNGTGSHRANTDEELVAMVGPRCSRTTASSTTTPTTRRRWSSSASRTRGETYI